MAFIKGADPDAFPGGRQRKGLDPLNDLFIFNRVAFEIEVGKSGAAAFAPEAGGVAIDVAQADEGGGFFGIGGETANSHAPGRGHGSAQCEEFIFVFGPLSCITFGRGERLCVC